MEWTNNITEMISSDLDSWAHTFPRHGYAEYADMFDDNHTEYDSNQQPMCSNYTWEDLMRTSPGYLLCMHVLLPIVCSVGIVGIILTIIVLSQKSMSTSTNCYLVSLAVTDLCYLVFLSTFFFERIMTGVHFYFYHVLRPYVEIILSFLLLVSVWLTVMLAIERYIAICHPLRAMSICTVIRAKIIIIMIVVTSFLFRLPIFFEYEVISFYNPCFEADIIQIQVSEFAQNSLYRHIYKWMDCFLLAAVPFQILLFLNCCLIREIHRSTNYLRYHLANDSNVQTIIVGEEIKITMMLISVVVVFFLCEAPYIVMTVLKSFHVDQNFLHMSLLISIGLLLLALRSCGNFIMYCWFSEKFWNTLRKTFCKSNCIISQGPAWIRTRVLNNSDHGHSNNNRKISYFNTKETTC